MIFLAGTVLFAILLISKGFLTAEFGGPDEAAHLVSGIMVRQYLLEGLPQGTPPMQFARDYYNHYPKVAIGHWPPAFYALQGVWYVVAGVSRESILAFTAMVSGLWVVTLVYVARLAGAGWKVAIFGSLVLGWCLPWIDASKEFGSDPLTAVFTVWAAIACHFWLKSLSWRSGLSFAGLGALAVLTKGNAFPLFLLPALVVVRPDRFRAILRPNFWVPLLLLVALALPWYWAQREISAGEVMPGRTHSVSNRLLRSAEMNFFHLNQMVVIPVLAVVLVTFSRERRSALIAEYPVILAVPLVFWAFMSFISPHTEARLMLASVVAGVLLVGAAAKLNENRPTSVFIWVAVAYPVFLFWIVQPKRQQGWVEAASLIEKLPYEKHLVVSYVSGEGALISELALHEPRPRLTTLRGSKVLQKSDWMGTHVVPIVNSEGDAAAMLERENLRVVVIDRTGFSGNAFPVPMFHLMTATRDWKKHPINEKIDVRERP